MQPGIINFFLATPDNNYHPPVLSYKAFVLYGLLLILIRILLGALPSQGAAVESQTLMKLINLERGQRNLTTLLTDDRLIQAATEKSQDMIDRDYFAHIDPDGNYVWPRIEKAGYRPYRILGENLAVDFSTSEGMVKAWIDSPTHRANLLHPEFADQGLGALYGDFENRFTNLTASLFGRLALPGPPTPAVKAERPPYSSPYSSPYATPYLTPYLTPSSKPLVPVPLPPPQAPATSTKITMPIETTPSGPLSPPAKITISYPSALAVSRVIFTLFGILLLLILAVDSVIIYSHELRLSRGHSSYHLFGFMLIVLISILIWWW